MGTQMLSNYFQKQMLNKNLVFLSILCDLFFGIHFKGFEPKSSQMPKIIRTSLISNVNFNAKIPLFLPFLMI